MWGDGLWNFDSRLAVVLSHRIPLGTRRRHGPTRWIRDVALRLRVVTHRQPFPQ